MRAVLTAEEKRCWVEREQVQDKSRYNVPGAIVGAVVGGVLGHQIGRGTGRDVATIGGAAAGGAVGANVGSRSEQVVSQDVQRCENVPGTARTDYWDVTYHFRGQEHHAQLTSPPGSTILVNEYGEPRCLACVTVKIDQGTAPRGRFCLGVAWLTAHGRLRILHAASRNRRNGMHPTTIDRRTLLKTAAALATIGLAPGVLRAQGNATRAPVTLPARGEFVIRDAIVLTMDESTGDFAGGDVHVRDGAIVAVAQAIAAPNADVIDARGMICLPGFIDTHVHLWTSALRAVIRMDDPKYGYFPVTNRLGPHYTPEDSYRNVRLGLAEALAAGATTVHNWAHNVRTPEHADAELRAMRDMGLRGRFSYGPAQGMPNGQPMDLEGVARIQRDWMPNDGVLTLGINSRNIGDDPNPLRGNIPLDIVKLEWTTARKMGLPIVAGHQNPEAEPCSDILNDAGPFSSLMCKLCIRC